MNIDPQPDEDGEDHNQIFILFNLGFISWILNNITKCLSLKKTAGSREREDEIGKFFALKLLLEATMRVKLHIY